ncbi:MAG: universal stress protein [Bacteroidia bacterium]
MFRVLLPTDFSKNSFRAISYVFKHFKHERIKLMLIHTIKAPHSAAGVLIRIDDLMRQDAERDMANLAQEIKDKYDVTVDSIIKIGHLNDWLKQYADSHKIDLVCMGTKGESDIGNKLLGSVTDSVIRACEVPVLAIPPKDDLPPVHQVAIATVSDKIPDENYVKRFMATLKLENPRVNVIRVVRKERNDLPKSIDIDQVQVGVEQVVNSSIVQGICKYAKEANTDLMLMYHVHSGKIASFFSKSSTVGVCGKIDIPLLVIPVK